MKFTKQEYRMERGKGKPDGILYYIDEVPGSNFPFQLYVPYELKENPDMILASRTPRCDSTLNFEQIIEHAAYVFDKEGKKIGPNGPNPVGRLLSYNLGNVCLMPVIPRAVGLEAPYLGRSIYKNDFTMALDAISSGESALKEEDVYKFKDLHLQVVNIIKAANMFLKEQGIDVQDKVIMSGFSAAAKFSIFFTALHPEMVKAVVAGGTGGNNIIPVKSFGLTYPLGVSDIEPEFDEEAFKEIPQFYFIGDDDYNDLTKFKTYYEKDSSGKFVRDVSGNKIPRTKDGTRTYHDEIRDDEIVHVQEKIPFESLDFDLDENGDYQLAYDDGNFTLDQVKFINDKIGHDVQERWKFMKKLYGPGEKFLNINAEFHNYPGDHATVFDKDKLYEDLEEFYNKKCLELGFSRK